MNDLSWSAQGKFGGFTIKAKSNHGTFKATLKKKGDTVTAYLTNWDTLEQIDVSVYKDYKTAKDKTMKDLKELLLTGYLL